MIASNKDELDLAEGILATDVFAHGMPLTPFGRKIVEAFKSKPTHFAGLGAEAYAILLNAMNRCSDPEDRMCVNQQIRSTNDFTGIVGKITIDSNGKAHRPRGASLL